MGMGHYYIYCNSPDYAAVYPGASLMALNVVLPELLLPPPMVIVILPLIPRYHSRVLPEFLLPPPMVIVILPLIPRYHSRVLPEARLDITVSRA